MATQSIKNNELHPEDPRSAYDLAKNPDNFVTTGN